MKNHLPMERLFTYADHYTSVDDHFKDYLAQRAQVRHYQAQEHFMWSGERKRCCCFVLSGMAAGVDCYGTDPVYRWLARPYAYFSGYTHPYSTTPQHLSIQLLRRTDLLVLPQDDFRYAQEHIPAFGTLVQVLKQKQILLGENLMRVLAEKRIDRFAALREYLPEYVKALNDEECQHLLQVDRSTYFRSKRR